jgi:hypothetical protein
MALNTNTYMLERMLQQRVTHEHLAEGLPNPKFQQLRVADMLAALDTELAVIQEAPATARASTANPTLMTSHPDLCESNSFSSRPTCSHCISAYRCTLRLTLICQSSTSSRIESDHPVTRFRSSLAPRLVNDPSIFLAATLRHCPVTQNLIFSDSSTR